MTMGHVPLSIFRLLPVIVLLYVTTIMFVLSPSLLLAKLAILNLDQKVLLSDMIVVGRVMHDQRGIFARHVTFSADRIIKGTQNQRSLRVHYSRLFAPDRRRFHLGDEYILYLYNDWFGYSFVDIFSSERIVDGKVSSFNEEIDVFLEKIHMLVSDNK